MKKLKIVLAVVVFPLVLSAGILRTVTATSSWQKSLVAAQIDCTSKLRAYGGKTTKGVSYYGIQRRTSRGVTQYAISCSCPR